ncbi:MAG: flagellin [Paenibacillus dendritiformis]|uniref:flagellin N-terminal helical domain-containing protein n=1 Tax=Paenibacillus dendritiformis TaxID=130049 RepID=UPI001B0ECAE5|nr:flagellin [Paenibacillus dendritiformis]MDU5141542.1 flagellin [Paenibacillus dendritiformis]GIO75454.1 flagellin [Paenibacillus dendritiformis]
MSMFINTNVGAINAHRNLGMNNTAMGKTMEKLSSGFRINRAADDAAGLAISEKMRFQIGGMNQAMRNAQDGISLIQTAEGALTEVHSMLQRLNTLANQAATGTYDAKDRANTQKEVDALIAEIDNIASSTNFNGIKLLNASATVSFQIGVEKGNTLTAQLKDMRAAELKVNSLSIGTQTAASNALSTIAAAINTVAEQRAAFGAVQNRLEHTINNLGVTAENLSASESRIRNADMAKEMTDFTRNQILVQAGTAMLAQANSAPQSVLKLLG